jgi:hypothetical protein
MALTSQEILQTADRSRGNLEGITWTVEICSTKNKKNSSMAISVKARGFDIATENLAPPKYKGNKLLMLRGSMWFYKPGLSKPVPISRRQKLLGDAVYGDIAATNYASDYTASPLPDETINKEPCYKFDLKSKNKKSTYDRIVYWISKKRMVGVKADYYTVSGKKFKSASMQYKNSVVIDGRQKPFISSLVIYNELMSRDVTTLNLTDPGLKALPDYFFNLNLLRR